MKRIIIFMYVLLTIIACSKTHKSEPIILDFNDLQPLKTEMKILLETSVAGIEDGTYPIESFDALNESYERLKIGISKANAGVFILQFEIDNYVLAAQKAIKQFKNSQNLAIPPGVDAELFVNGVDHKGYIDFGSSSDYAGGPQFTVECWTKCDEGFSEFVFGSFISTFISPLPYKGWTLHYWGTSNSLLRFSIGSDNSNPEITLPTIATPALPKFGEWFHIAAVFNSSTQKQQLFINGVLSAENHIVDNIVVSTDDTRMWAFVEPKDNSRCMSGYLKKFRIWSVGKTATEIQNLMKVDVSGSEKGLSCAWDFNKMPIDISNMPDKTGKHFAKIVGVHKWRSPK